jgi:diguanylate cyclase (GGDEF)-like protein
MNEGPSSPSASLWTIEAAGPRAENRAMTTEHQAPGSLLPSAGSDVTDRAADVHAPQAATKPLECLSRKGTVAIRGSFVLLALVIAAAAANALLDVGGPLIDEIMRTWASSFVYVLASGIAVARAVAIRQSRAAWILIASGLCLYAAGNLLWALWLEHMEAPPIPSIADALWLSLYPASYAGLVLLARRPGAVNPAGVRLDGIVAGLGIAALGAAIVFGPVLNSASGSPIAVATNLAYPVADLLLAALVMGILALRGWRLNAKWAAIGGGFLLLCVADILYLLHIAGGATAASATPNVFYMSGVGLLAFAAWQPDSREAPAAVESWSMLLVPATFVLTAVGINVYDHFHAVETLAVVLATLTMLAALVRTALSFRDLRSLAQTRREATTDDLTGLPNRRLFLRTVDESIVGARKAGVSLALLIIDLNDFKKLNDTLGHHAGDSLLCQIGPRLRRSLRTTDMLARLGGDEFGLLLSAPSGEAAALAVADKIREALRMPFEVQGLHLHVSASVGIALFPSHADDAERLLQHADVAMYQAKAARTGHEVYARDRDEHSREALQLACELPGAIAQGQLELHFQPIAEAAGARVVGMEALVRWAHPTRGLLSPADFVPLVEQSGLTRDMTRWVLDAALARCHAWRQQGHRLSVSVNVGVADVLDVEFPQQVAAALAKHELDPAALIIEVTESSIMSDRRRIGDVLARLGELGVGISLDDFGTGYSSLVHLKTLPVSEVKIDRGFVARMDTDPTDRAIVRSTIQLAHNLGMHLVAEGVEDDATWKALAGLGCELIQGYHLARPLAVAELDAFLAAIPRDEELLDPVSALESHSA